MLKNPCSWCPSPWSSSLTQHNSSLCTSVIMQHTAWGPCVVTWASRSCMRQRQYQYRHLKARSTIIQAWLNQCWKSSCCRVTPLPLGKVSWAKPAADRPNHPTEYEAHQPPQRFQSSEVKERLHCQVHTMTRGRKHRHHEACLLAQH